MIVENSYGKFKYMLYDPDHLQDKKNLPLIVVMHGSGEIGSSLSKLKKREPYISLKNGKFKTNAWVLMPQLPKGTWGKMAADLMKLISFVAEAVGCDTGRISLTGHSLGAMGVIEIMSKYPNSFSAGASLSCAKDYKSELPKLSHIPLYFLHGAKEHNYKRYAQLMYAVMADLNDEAKLVSVSGYGHPIQFTWVSSKYGIFDWLTQFRVGDLKNPTWEWLLKDQNLLDSTGSPTAWSEMEIPDALAKMYMLRKSKSWPNGNGD